MAERLYCRCSVNCQFTNKLQICIKIFRIKQFMHDQWSIATRIITVFSVSDNSVFRNTKNSKPETAPVFEKSKRRFHLGHWMAEDSRARFLIFLQRCRGGTVLYTRIFRNIDCTATAITTPLCSYAIIQSTPFSLMPDSWCIPLYPLLALHRQSVCRCVSFYGIHNME